MTPEFTANVSDDNISVDKALLQACAKGSLPEIKELIDNQDADPCFHDKDDNGASPLIEAAKHGHAEVVSYLISEGAPWNALDMVGKCAGDYAMDNGHTEAAEVLLNTGIQAELLLGTLERMKRLQGSQHDDSDEEEEAEQADSKCSSTEVTEAYKNPTNTAYLREKLRYDGADRLVDEEQKGVMMSWESPLMEAHAYVIAWEGADVLNVGFGLGIVDTFIQKRNPRSHTIIEAHPDVYARMLAEGWDKKPGVKIIFGRWQDAMKDLGDFDGIFWDTWMEDYIDLQEFQAHLPSILRPDGRYSFFNGLGATNAFFHTVYLHLVRLDLGSMGYATEYVDVPVARSVQDDKTWDGLSQKYWQLDTYYLPIITKETEEEGEEKVISVEEDEE